jgi:hypothetical protein
MKTLIQTQQFGISQILNLGGKIFSSNFRKILTVILCVNLPKYILGLANIDAVIEPLGLEGHINALILGSIGVLQLLIQTIGTTAIAYLVERFIYDENTTWKQALRHGASRFPSQLGTSLLSILILTGLTLLLIVPGLIWSVYYIFLIYVVAIRGIGGMKALDYSKMLVQGQWWRVLRMSLILGFLLGIAFVGLDVCNGILLSLPLMLLPITNPAVETIFEMAIIATKISTDMLGALFCVTATVWFLNVDYLKNPSSRPHVAIPETASA